MNGSAFALLITPTLVASTLVGCTLVAQPPRVPLPVGARVRVAAAPRSDWVVGRLSHADSVRIVLRAAPGAIPDTFPLTAIQALEVSRGRPRALRVGIGMVVGGVAVGTAAGLIAKVLVRGEPDGELVVGAAVVAGVAGGVIAGGAVGGLTAPERWRRVPVP